MSDVELSSHLNAAPVLGAGIGGVRQTIRVGEVPVFVKRIPVTDLERSSANLESTANLFDLPVGCQYGVGSPSFGVWREVAANAMATGWFRSGQEISHPLMYHWRVVDEQEPLGPLCDELADVDRFVEYWHGSAAVRQRVEAITASTASVVLFLEYLPTTLPDWLRQQIARDEATANAAIEMVAERLRVAVASMNDRSLFHFDTHLGNILSDDDRIYIADLGLATSPEFDLSVVEVQFIQSNVSHDVAQTMTRLVDWLVAEFVTGADYVRRNDLVRIGASRHDHASSGGPNGGQPLRRAGSARQRLLSESPPREPKYAVSEFRHRTDCVPARGVGARAFPFAVGQFRGAAGKASRRVDR